MLTGHAAASDQASRQAAQLWGINLAGAEFGNLPGTHGTEYLYPTPSNLAYYAGLGFKLVRIPFKWERLQPRLREEFAAVELSLLTNTVDKARQLEQTVVLDPHNYCKRRVADDGWTREYLIGSAEVPVGTFVDLWERLADVFGEVDKVMFGLMNEPAGIDAASWLEIANAAIAGIRKRGAHNMVLVPGTAYTGAHSWFRSGNTAMERVQGPARNFALDVHQYLDADSSGAHSDAVSSTVGSERLEPFQAWARQRGLRALLGEYGANADERSLRALMDMLDEVAANSDVWLGSAAWAGGPRWPDDSLFNLEPTTAGHMRRQTEIIRSRAVPVARDYWADRKPALYVDFARDIVAGAEKAWDILRSDSTQTPSNSASSPQGLRIDTMLGQKLVAHGALAALLQKSTFTVMFELRDLGDQRRRRDVLSCSGRSLIHRSPDGALSTELAGGLSTSVYAFEENGRKWRCALSVGEGDVAIAMTGVPPRGKSLAPGLPAGLDIEIGSGPAGQLNGTITRIIGFPYALTVEELGKAVT